MFIMAVCPFTFLGSLVIYMKFGMFVLSVFCRQYREYIENLLEYLIYFFQRTKPLEDLDRIFSKVSISVLHEQNMVFSFCMTEMHALGFSHQI